jgi:hypothetical protein
MHHARGTGAIVDDVVTHPPHARVVVARASLAAGLHAARVVIIGVIFRPSVRPSTVVPLASSRRVVPTRERITHHSSLVFFWGALFCLFLFVSNRLIE